jgi:hypothetical protein
VNGLTARLTTKRNLPPSTPTGSSFAAGLMQQSAFAYQIKPDKLINFLNFSLLIFIGSMSIGVLIPKPA